MPTRIGLKAGSARTNTLRVVATSIGSGDAKVPGATTAHALPPESTPARHGCGHGTTTRPPRALASRCKVDFRTLSSPSRAVLCSATGAAAGNGTHCEESRDWTSAQLTQPPADPLLWTTTASPRCCWAPRRRGSIRLHCSGAGSPDVAGDAGANRVRLRLLGHGLIALSPRRSANRSLALGHRCRDLQLEAAAFPNHHAAKSWHDLPGGPDPQNVTLIRRVSDLRNSVCWDSKDVVRRQEQEGRQ
jgi:hypothetical protein